MAIPLPGQTEFELGVAIPGTILPPERWVRTALKKVPEGHINWELLFERTAPVVIDIGCGNGRYLLHSAISRPDLDHLGLDILPVVIRYATRRANQRGLANTRWAVMGGSDFLADHVAPHSVSEIHCYHPQPYYRREDVPKRLITPAFLRAVHTALVPGGRFYIQTDHPAYWNYMQAVIPVFFNWTELASPWPDTPQGRTRRELLARKQKLKVFRGEGTARLDINPDESEQLAADLPLPKFNADRRLQRLDALERQ